MSDLLNQVQNIDSLSFEDARNTAAYIGMAVLPAITGVAVLDYFRTPRTDADSLKGADPELLGEVVDDERSGRFKSRFGRWGSPMLIGLGISVASLSLLAPTTEHETTITGTKTLMVVDGSYSMSETTDMSNPNQTRLSAVMDSIATSSRSFPKDLMAGTVVFGNNAEVFAPLTTDRTLLTGDVDSSKIDPNGGALNQAVSLGDSILSGSDNSTGQSTMFIFTDGTVDSPDLASAEIQSVAEKGTKVVLVMPGTSDGNYIRSQYDSPIPSGVQNIQFEELDALENVEIVTTNDESEIQNVIDNRINIQTKRTERKSTNIFTLAGGLLASAGFMSNIRRTWKRKV
ncbi:MAG: vWA domain-containing protein [Candidatus Saccharibacteria bacterium]|nr:vWA domain-containing protein [Candidatus Saccharibacteria bacterium]